MNGNIQKIFAVLVHASVRACVCVCVRVRVCVCVCVCILLHLGQSYAIHCRYLAQGAHFTVTDVVNCVTKESRTLGTVHVRKLMH